jgi:DNA-3-methyladenine glycosylase I
VTVGLVVAFGLCWLTILRKRENFREAFAGFDPDQVAGFGDNNVTLLLDNAGIVRHEGKIRSTINNARKAHEIVDEFGSLRSYFWSWVGSEDAAPVEIPATTDTSSALANDLKKRGWSFVGPTTVYAFMQAVGLVNDHIDGCHVRNECAEERRRVMATFF